jgi:hypothetical protein
MAALSGTFDPARGTRHPAILLAFAASLWSAGASAQVLPLSALDGTNGFRINGVTINDQSGFDVTGIGDLNGDGLDDVAIGAARADGTAGSDAGSTYVVFGRSGVPFPALLELGTLNGSTGFRIDGVAAGDNAGAAIANAGDVNGDGRDDLIIGAPFADNTGTTSGSTYVVFGRAAGGFTGAVLNLGTLDGSTGFRLDGAGAGHLSGDAVAGAGDINGDGRADLVIGAQSASPNGDTSGASFVVFGRSGAGAFPATLALGTLNGTTGFRLDGAAAFDASGVAVSGAGDVNGDGVDDLLIGARRAAPGSGSNAGSTYVVFGRTAAFAPTLNLGTLGGTTGFRIDGAAVDDTSALAVAAAGDVNGDGRDDLIIGAAGADPGGASAAGSSYVLYGRSSPAFPAVLGLGSLDGNTGFRIDGALAGDGSGNAVAAAGDINGDGIGDLLVGASLADPNGTSSGSVYLVHGRASPSFPATLALAALNGSDGFRLDGVQVGNFTGRSVAAAGDVNGDGKDDFMIGADGADPPGAMNAGSTFIVYGDSPLLFRNGFE